jgi:hypothetical protein
MQKSTLNGSHETSVGALVDVIAGEETGVIDVLVGIAIVLITMGVAVGVSIASTCAQATRMNNTKRFSIRFIPVARHCEEGILTDNTGTMQVSNLHPTG